MPPQNMPLWHKHFELIIFEKLQIQENLWFWESLIGFWHAIKSGFYTTTHNDQLSHWSEKKLQSTSQSQICTPKRVMVAFWWSAASLIHYSEPQQNHYIWEVCSADGWNAPKTATAALSIGQQKGSNSSPQQLLTAGLTTNASKPEGPGLQSFSSSTILTWRLANWLPLL